MINIFQTIHIYNIYVKNCIKIFKEITPEIVKNKLDEHDNTLDIYKKSLELKIKNINDLLRINDCIINII